ncbi:MAG TPA: hypothetical protein IGP91_06870 [Thermosynechococcus sp. M46_R2017_013]|nr:hypothetical protein [Thermosynechococcus sp. M46_R2017_013]
MASIAKFAGRFGLKDGQTKNLSWGASVEMGVTRVAKYKPEPKISHHPYGAIAGGMEYVFIERKERPYYKLSAELMPTFTLRGTGEGLAPLLEVKEALKAKFEFHFLSKEAAEKLGDLTKFNASKAVKQSLVSYPFLFKGAFEIGSMALNYNPNTGKGQVKWSILGFSGEASN